MHFDIDAARATSTLKLRVRFCDTDLMGIVHHANYLEYFEAGRVEWLRRRGVTYVDWATTGLHLPVVEANVRYKSVARFDDLLDVETRLGELRSASLRFEYRLLRAGDLIAEGFTRLACVNDAHQLRRFTPEMTRVFLDVEQPDRASSVVA